MHFNQARIAAAGILSGCIAVLLATPTLAGPSTDFLTIEAQNANGSATLTFPTASATWTGSSWVLSTGATTLANGARVGNVSVVMTEDRPFTSVVDPQVLLIYDVSADGAMDTQFTISTATLNFPALSPAIGDFSGAVNVVDSANSDGVTLSGAGSGGNAVFAFFNGGSVFYQDVGSVAAPQDATNNAGALDFIGGIGVPVVDIRAELNFTLTRGDTSTGQADFVVIPEPSAIVLLLFGTALAIRRGR